MRGMSYLVEFMYQFMNTNTINSVWVPIWTFWRKHTNSAVILFLTLYGIQPMVSVFFTLNGVTCATGGRNMFSRHQWRKLPKVLGESPTPPTHPSKRPYFQILTPISKYMAPKFKCMAPRSISPKLKYITPKCKHLNQNSNQWIFVTLKPPELYEENSQLCQLINTHPFIGVSKKLKCPPLVINWVSATQERKKEWRKQERPHSNTLCSLVQTSISIENNF